MEAETYYPALTPECETMMMILEGDNMDNIYDLNLQDRSPSPEEIIISKDTFRALSDEARELMHLILNCHHEFFLQSGKLKKIPFQNYCKQVKGWDKTKTEALKFELGLFLKFAFN